MCVCVRARVRACVRACVRKTSVQLVSTVSRNGSVIVLFEYFFNKVFTGGQLEQTVRQAFKEISANGRIEIGGFVIDAGSLTLTG